MTHDTSSRSAPTTTSGTDGPPPTAPSSASIFQDAIDIWSRANKPTIVHQQGSWPIRFFIWRCKAKHLLGIHSMIEAWDIDVDTDSLRPRGLECVICSMGG